MAIKLELLKKIHYLAGLNDDELQFVKKHITVEQTADKGEIFLIEGEWSDYLYFLVSGVAKVYKTSVDGKEQIMHIATAGESLNDVSTFDGGPNAASMEAMTPVLLYAVKKNDLQGLLEKYSRICFNTIRAMANRVRRDSTLVKELSFDHVTVRLAKLLLKYHEEESEWPRLTQQDIASMIGTTREVVNRSLRTLEEHGAIRIDRHGISIVNQSALEEMAKAGL